MGGEHSSSEDTPATALLSDPGPPSPHGEDTRTIEPPNEPVALAVGDRVGRFSVLGRLGAGGMGIVYAAYDPELDRRVAIKLVAYKTATREANLRLLREAQAMARLSHPNVVSIYDVGDLEGRAVFIAMEYVDGTTFGEWLRAEQRTWPQIRDVLVQAGRGLAAAHRSGLVHRDFKPSNLLVSPDGRARVGDFGIARLDETDDVSAEPAASGSSVTPLAIALTRTGSALGTPAYMAPEQHRGATVDARGDQFAFCVTAWEAAYGERPFPTTKPSELLARIEAKPAKPPARDVPPQVEAILRRGLELAPVDRWPNLDALLDRLADDPSARRRRRVAIAAALVTVGALGAGAATLAGNRETDPCALGDGELSSTWNPLIRASVDVAFHSTRSRLANENWPHVASSIDRWAGQWVSNRVDACRKHVDHVQSSALYDRRVMCLLRERSRLDALVDVLRKPDPNVVRDAPMAAAVLPPPADCGDVDLLLGKRALPENPAVRAEVRTMQAGIERADTLRTFGRYREALDSLLELEKRSAHIDYSLLTAEVAFAVGQSQSDLAEPGAEASMRKAADAAAVARSTEIYARALAGLVYEIGFKRARYDDAKPLRPLAWQAVHLAGDDLQLTSDLQFTDGAVDVMHGDFAAAIPSLESAIKSLEARYGKDSVRLVSTLNLYAVVLGHQHELTRAQAIYERALDILSKTIGPGHPRVSSLLGNLGGIAFDQGRLQDSLDLYKRALAVQEAALDADDANLATALNNVAQPLWALGKWDEAYALIDRARKLWETQLGHEHPYVAAALTNLGGLRQEQGRCSEGVKLLDDAMQMQAKLLPVGHPSQTMTMLFLGGCKTDLGKPAEALPLIEKTIAFYKASGTPVELAGARFELARAQWELGRDKPGAVAMAEDARKIIADDPADKAMVAAGAKSGSIKIAEWLRGKH